MDDFENAFGSASNDLGKSKKSQLWGRSCQMVRESQNLLLRQQLRPIQILNLFANEVERKRLSQIATVVPQLKSDTSLVFVIPS